MKQINLLDTAKIAGGTVMNVVGNRIWVDTQGVPGQCVSLMEDSINALFNGDMAAVLAHAEAMVDTGCDAYNDLLNQRIERAVLL